MSSLLKISNKNLRKLGIDELPNMNVDGKPAARCRATVEEIVLEVTREHPWSHATVWVKLPALVEVPPFGYQYAYQLPANCERVVDVREEEDLKAPIIDFEEVRGQKIYTDASVAYTRIVVYYETDLAKAKADFINACACKMAVELAPSLAKTKDTAVLFRLYQYALDRAMLNDTATVNERKQDENRTTSILAARGYPASVNDDDSERTF